MSVWGGFALIAVALMLIGYLLVEATRDNEDDDNSDNNNVEWFDEWGPWR